ncbi:PIN domain-containing protein [Paraburkholderia ginsengisoli]|uniref:PIN domain-containing protein n=1 Tax=Paraburkholderia ginsengisoli TaxID=311231 RepID=UPI0005A7017F|nr:PIN domain-containing protein [Paraburkholderia ginsengisoli]
MKQLESLAASGFRLVFSEMTLKEIRGHLAKKTEEARSSLQKGLADSVNHWALPEEKRKQLLRDVVGDADFNAASKARLSAFLERCKAEIAGAQEHLEVDKLIALYFDQKAPFESTKDKKSEFPDAITLLSLGSWATKQKTSVLFVTRDKGCISYCETAERLAAIDDLGAALTLVQERNEHTRKLTDTVAQRIQEGAYPDFLEQLTSTIANNVHDLNIIPEASSSFYFDAEMEDEHVVDAEFESKDGRPVLNPVGYVNDVLTVQGIVTVNLGLVGAFSFSMRDGIDRDMVRIGHGRAEREVTVSIEVLYTFEDFEDGEPELVEIEIVPTRFEVDFGEVNPDY